MKRIVVLLGLIMLIIGCGTGNYVKNVEPVRIGFIGPLTGDVSSVGEVIRAGVELARDEINSQGGIDGRPIRIIFEDGKCTAKDAFNAGNKLINVDKVKYILSGCSPGTLAIAPLAEMNQVVIIAYVSSSPDVTNAGDYIFRNYKNDLDAGKAAASYMKRYDKVALLWSLNDYSQGLASVFRDSFEGEVVFEESFEQGIKDLRSIITKLKDSDAEAVFLVEFTEGVITYFTQAEELGLNIPVYGADNFDDPKLIAELGSVFDGARYVEVKESASDEFKAKIKSITGSDSLPVGVANAYDAVHILAEAISAVGDNSTAVKNYLYTMPSYSGESGLIKFDKNGDLDSKEFELREVRYGKVITQV